VFLAETSSGVVLIALLFGIGLAALVALKAREKGRSFGIWFAFALFLFLPALIAVAIIKPTKTCPSCAKAIPKAANICPYCGAAQA